MTTDDQSVADHLLKETNEYVQDEHLHPSLGPIEPSVLDLANLMIVDANELDMPENAQTLKTDELQKRARDATQVILNDLYALPTKRVDDVLCIELPTGTKYTLPREKPMPVPKPLTKWQQFALSKGIVSKAGDKRKKRANLVWDETTREWVPRFGSKKVTNDVKKTWMVELKQNDDMADGDPFEREERAKKERVNKNELQRLKNVSRANKLKATNQNAVDVDGNVASQTATTLSTSNKLALLATASQGKFQPPLQHSKVVKNNKNKNVESAKKMVVARLNKDSSKVSSAGTTRRKFDSLHDTIQEKERSLEILDSMTLTKPTVIDTSTVKTVQTVPPEKRGTKNKKSGGKRSMNRTKKSFSADKKRNGGSKKRGIKK